MMAFDGLTFAAEYDGIRLAGQLARVWHAMLPGAWLTLEEIRGACSPADTLPAISARLRDFRKPRWGGHTVARRRRGPPHRGCFEYRLIPRPRQLELAI